MSVVPRSIISDGRWVALARLNARVADYAHLPKLVGPVATPFGETLGSGAIVTACGMTGRPLAITPGARINPCKNCEEWA